MRPWPFNCFARKEQDLRVPFVAPYYTIYLIFICWACFCIALFCVLPAGVELGIITKGSIQYQKTLFQHQVAKGIMATLEHTIRRRTMVVSASPWARKQWLILFGGICPVFQGFGWYVKHEKLIQKELPNMGVHTTFDYSCPFVERSHFAFTSLEMKFHCYSPFPGG